MIEIARCLIFLIIILFITASCSWVDQLRALKETVERAKFNIRGVVLTSFEFLHYLHNYYNLLLKDL